MLVKQELEELAEKKGTVTLVVGSNATSIAILSPMVINEAESILGM